MSKKRKTKKEKLKSATRHISITQNPENHEDHQRVSYSVADIKSIPTTKAVKQNVGTSLSSTVDLTKFIKADIRKILIASGGIFAFNIILFALLHFNIIKLGFLGY